MRGIDDNRDAMFIYLSPEDFVPADHPLRPIRTMVDATLEGLSAEFNRCQSTCKNDPLRTLKNDPPESPKGGTT